MNEQVLVCNKRRQNNLSCVCRETVAVPKGYNLRRHLKTQHPTIAELDRNEKSLKAVSLMKSLGKKQQFFKVFDNESAKATNVSFQI